MRPPLPHHTLDQIKAQYPDEWILVGNPDIQKTKVMGGIVLYHSKDKKEVCYIGRSYTAGYSKITLTFTGQPKSIGRIGIMKRV